MTVGAHQVAVRLHPEVSATIDVEAVAGWPARLTLRSNASQRAPYPAQSQESRRGTRDDHSARRLAGWSAVTPVSDPAGTLAGMTLSDQKADLRRYLQQ